jgi:hypothetical protein
VYLRLCALAADVAGLGAQLSESNVQESPPTETSPFSLQPYVAPRGGVRFVVAYMRNEHGTTCESFPVPYATRYLDVAHEYDATVPPRQPALPAVSDETLLRLRHTTLSAVTFMRKAHGLQLDALMLEFVQDAEKRLWFHATIGLQLPGKPATWTSRHDVDSKLVRDLVNRLYQKQPALRVFQRSSLLPCVWCPPAPPWRALER